MTPEIYGAFTLNQLQTIMEQTLVERVGLPAELEEEWMRTVVNGAKTICFVNEKELRDYMGRIYNAFRNRGIGLDEYLSQTPKLRTRFSSRRPRGFYKEMNREELDAEFRSHPEYAGKGRAWLERNHGALYHAGGKAKLISKWYPIDLRFKAQ